jgi:Kef-type K+ transport system membrane component KefB
VIAPPVQRWIFPDTGMSAAALGAVYQLGLLLLMFAAGAEMRRLLQRSAVRTVGLIASFGLVLPFAAGLGWSPSLVSASSSGQPRTTPRWSWCSG